jgi:hypothetical protein
MKAVYIVTDGTYSDYTIERVFSNPEAAEEYKKWKRITNEVEEFVIHDEPFTEEDGRRAMLIRVQGTVYPEAVVNIEVNIVHNLTYEESNLSGAGIVSCKKDGAFDVYVYRHVPVRLWSKEKYKAKLTKTLYDLAAVAKSMFAEGATVDMVNEALMNKFEEEQA